MRGHDVGTEPTGTPAPARWFGGYGLLAVAVVVAIGVAAYFLFSSGDDAPASSETGAAFNGTPLAQLSGVKPSEGTGVLDPERPEEGKRAPDFALLDAHDGKTVRRLSDYRGKVVVLNWYASWCGPCKREIPELQRLTEQLAGQVVIFGVDPLETKEKAGGILDELKATYPAVLDSSGEVTDHYRVGKGLPKTYFIDREGILRGVKTGELRPEELAKFLAQMGVTYTPK